MSSKLKKLFICLFVLSVILFEIPFIAIIFAPPVLSSKWGQEKILEQINNRIDGKVEFKSLDLNLNGPQIIEGLKGIQNGISLDISSIQLDLSFWQLVKQAWQSKFDLKFSELDGTVAYQNHKFDFDHLSGTLNFKDQIFLFDLDGNINSSEGLDSHISLSAQIKNKILTLNEPLKATFSLTPQLSRHLLKGLVPLFGEIVSAESSGNLSIEPEGFFYKIDNSNSIDIGKMRLDLGKINFNTKGQLQNLLSLLEEKPKEKISVWFTPLYINMHEGKLQLARMDMLVSEKYPLALWGTVNFTKDKLHMTLGLWGKTLENLIKGSPKDPNNMIQIPLKGKLEETNLDMSKIGKKWISQTASSALESFGLGFIADLASVEKKEAAPSPKPTTSPFPWDEK